MTENYDAREALAAAARRANQAIRVTGVDESELLDVAHELGQLADRLAKVEVPGPHYLLDLGPATPGSQPQDVTEPADYFKYSPVIGPLNPISPPAQLRVAEDKTVDGSVVFGTTCNGPPWDLVHGGVIAEVFDEVLGVAAMVGAGGGFTARLTIHYHNPTPINEELTLRGWVELVHGRRIVAKGEMYHGDVLTATAEGLFVTFAAPPA